MCPLFDVSNNRETGVFSMEDRKCVQCGNTKGKFMEKEGLLKNKAYFCDNGKCFDEYKKKGEEQGVCEFC